MRPLRGPRGPAGPDLIEDLGPANALAALGIPIFSVEHYGAVGDGVADDTDAVQDAIDAAAAAGGDLFVPGVYLTTASITNFHAVRKFGSGAIKGASTTFYVALKSGQTNVLYFGAGGSAGNDGLDATRPMLTLQEALDAWETYNVVHGQWRLQATAGTTGGQNIVPPNAANQKALQIWGDAPTTVTAGSFVVGGTYTIASVGTTDFTLLGAAANTVGLGFVASGVGTGTGTATTPSTIFDGTAGGANYGLVATGTFIHLKDIKFQKYSADGVYLGDGKAFLEGFHGDDNGGYGVQGRHMALWMSGGTIRVRPTGLGGCLMLMGTVHNIGRALDMTDGTTDTVGVKPAVTSDTVSGRGVLFQEGSTGHGRIDILGCATGLDLTSFSRVHLSDSVIRGCTVGIDNAQGNWFDGGGNDFRIGLSDANVTPWRRMAGAVRATEGYKATAWYVLQEDLTDYALDGGVVGTTETFFKAYTLPVGEYMGKPNSVYSGRVLRLYMEGLLSGTNGGKTLKAYLGPIVVAGSFVAASDYVIASLGTTDFTAIGAASNTVGLKFTASGAGTGTGTAVATATATASANMVAPSTPSGRFDAAWTMYVLTATTQKIRSFITVSAGVNTKNSTDTTIDFSTATPMGLIVSGTLANAGDDIDVNVMLLEARG